MGATSSLYPTPVLTAPVQPWQKFHQWLAEIARFGDSLDVGVRERNEDSGLSYWVRWGRLKNRFQEGRANEELSLDVFMRGLLNIPG